MWKFIKLNKQAILGVVFAAVIMAVLQIPNKTKLADPDGFYHAKASQLLVQGSLPSSFPYLAYTTWKDGYADQHYLYHVFLAPFNDINHIYISIILFALIFVALFVVVLKEMKIGGEMWWVTLLMLGSTDFLFRINLVKANTLSLALLFLLILLTVYWHRKKKLIFAAAIAAVSFLFVWTYGGFVFVPMILGFYSLAVLITKRKIDAVPLLASMVGIALGFYFHPHSNNLWSLLYDQIFLTGLGAGTQVPAGNEWKAYNLVWFIKSDLVVVMLYVLSVIVWVHSLIKKHQDSLLSWIHFSTLSLLVMALWHRRFIEYFVPFAVLVIAMTLMPYIKKISWDHFKKTINEYWQPKIALSICVLIVLCSAIYNFQNTFQFLDSGESISEYKELSQIIANESSEGDLVIDTQWDQFPQLFYWNSKNYYPVGLDPTFMFIYNPDLYWDWRKIADDNEGEWESIEHLHSLASDKLKARFLFIDPARNEDIGIYIEREDSDRKYFTPIYNSEKATVYKILP